MQDNYKFPQYRKYSNSASYFRIDSSVYFDELKKMPGGFVHYGFQVKILPDRNYIMDMLNCEKGYWVEISADEYEQINAGLNKSV